MKPALSKLWCCLLVSVCLALPTVAAVHDSGEEYAYINADDFDYLEGGVVHARTNVVMRYGGATLYSEEIIYDKNADIVQSPGWTRVVYENYEVNGQKVIFNIKTKAGQFENAHAVADFGPFQHEGHWYERKWYAYGKKITKDPHVNVFHIDNGKVTTCPPEYQRPLYYFEAKKLTIIPPDKKDPNSRSRIVARNCFLKFEGVPILWLPQLTYTMREDDTQSPVQLGAGYDSEKGGFVQAAIDIYRSENLRVTPHVAYYSEHGVAFGVDGSYYYQYTNITRVSGTWQTFFLEDLSRQFIVGTPDKDEKEGDTMWRYRFLWEHTQEFGPGAGWLKDGLLMWEVDLLSDTDVTHDFFRDDYDENGPRDTWLDFTKPIGPDNEVSIYVVKQINDFYTTYERLPELRHVFKKRRILKIPALNIPVYYESQSRAGYYHYIENDEMEDHTSYSLWRAWTDHRISAPKRYFGFLNIEPYIGLAAQAGHVSSYRRGETILTNAAGRLDEYTTRKPPIVSWMPAYNRYTRVPIMSFIDRDEGSFFHVFPYAGVDINFKMNRTYDLEGTYTGELMRKYLSSDNAKLRHIIEPFVQPFGIAGFGTDTGLGAGVNFGVRNALQIKRRGRNVNLVDLTICQSIRTLSGDLFEEPTYTRTFTRRRDRFAQTDSEKWYTPDYALGFDLRANPFDWLMLEGDMVWDMDKYNRITRVNFYARTDVSWLVQRFFASPWMVRPLRGRKDEVIIYQGYRYLYDYSNLITVGSRFWFDDFTPLLSAELQQKAWARELSRGWGFGFDVRYEACYGDLQEMEYTIYKNWKKCLDTALVYRMRDGDQAIMATFWLTAYPESKLELGN